MQRTFPIEPVVAGRGGGRSRSPILAPPNRPGDLSLSVGQLSINGNAPQHPSPTPLNVRRSASDPSSSTTSSASTAAAAAAAAIPAGHQKPSAAIPAGHQKPSAAARRLVKAQDQLAAILQQVRAASPDKYTKHGHWAWYVWPTTKEGVSDPCSTAVVNAADAAFVLSSASTRANWTALLEELAKALRTRATRRVFPSVDHGRIDYFLREWSRDEYRERMRGFQAFTAAVDAFGKAWGDAR
jgi:hypothetical protein